MHLYWGYPLGKNCASANNIFKVMNFKTNSHFALFGSFGKYANYTKFINAHNTHRNTNIHRHMHTHKQNLDIDTILTFCTFKFGTPQTHRYMYTHRHTHVQRY